MAKKETKVQLAERLFQAEAKKKEYFTGYNKNRREYSIIFNPNQWRLYNIPEDIIKLYEKRSIDLMKQRRAVHDKSNIKPNNQRSKESADDIYYKYTHQPNAEREMSNHPGAMEQEMKKAGIPQNVINFYKNSLATTWNNRKQKVATENSPLKPSLEENTKGVSNNLNSSATENVLPQYSGRYDFDKLYKDQLGYNNSLTAGNTSGTYAIDSTNWKNIHDIENSDNYKRFTDYVLNNPTSLDVLNYLKWLDSKRASDKKFTTIDENGNIKLTENALQYFKEAREDGLGGIVHFTPNFLKDAYAYGTPGGNYEYFNTPEELLSKYPNAMQYAPESAISGDESIYDNVYQYGPALEQNIPSEVENELKSKEEELAPQEKAQTLYKPTWMRSLPIYGSGIALLDSLLEKPDYSGVNESNRIINENYRPVNIPYDTIGDYRRTNPYDENYAVNLANAQNAMGLNAAMNSSGGNRGIQQAAALQSGYNRQLEMANIARQAMAANRADEEQVAQFNRGTNQANVTWGNSAMQTEATTNANIRSQKAQSMLNNVKYRQALKDQLDQARMTNFTNLMNNTQNYGRENLAWNQFAWQNNNGYFGNYGNSYFNDILGVSKFLNDNGYKIVQA